MGTKLMENIFCKTQIIYCSISTEKQIHASRVTDQYLNKLMELVTQSGKFT